METLRSAYHFVSEQTLQACVPQDDVVTASLHGERGPRRFSLSETVPRSRRVTAVAGLA